MTPGNTHRIRILLVDDQQLIRGAVRILVESWSGMEVVGEASRVGEAVNIAVRRKPEIILVDLHLGHNGHRLEPLRELIAAAGESRIILLTCSRETTFNLRALRLGVVGLVQKERTASELRKAIQKVHAGEAWLDRSIAAKVIIEMARPARKNRREARGLRIFSLTDREREIATLLCEGLKNRDIGRRLFICEATVRHHLSSIFQKLGVSNRFELIALLYRTRFIDVPPPELPEDDQVVEVADF